MGGVKGRSGPPSNLNNCKRPWAVFWRRRALRPQDKWVLLVLERYTEGLVADKGGEQNISAAEGRMVEIAQTARGATMLILAEAARKGFIRQTEQGWDLHPGAKELARFLGIERQTLEGLGLARRPRDLEDDFVARAQALARAQQAQAAADGDG